jgi:hypothetical protein
MCVLFCVTWPVITCIVVPLLLEGSLQPFPVSLVWCYVYVCAIAMAVRYRLHAIEIWVIPSDYAWFVVDTVALEHLFSPIVPMRHVCLLPGSDLVHPVGATAKRGSVSPHTEYKKVQHIILYSVLTLDCSLLVFDTKWHCRSVQFLHRNIWKFVECMVFLWCTFSLLVSTH